MLITKKVFSFFLFTFLFFNSYAQYSYRDEMNKLDAAINKYFLDKKTGYYTETVESEKNENPYSYLWPVCALFQAANEMEKLGNENKLKPLLQVIRDYYDPAPPAPGYASYIVKLKGGDRFYDDNQWIGITAMDAYERTGKKEYLEIGKEIYRYMMTGYDTVLGGGIYWQENKKISKNTCSNGPGIILALQLYQSTKQQTYLDTAIMIYEWVDANLQTPVGLYYDNVAVESGKTDKRQYSYNTGTMLQSNVLLYEITDQKTYLQQAIRIAESSVPFFYSGKKFKDDFWFNAVMLRGYQHLYKHHPDKKYLQAFRAVLDNELAESKGESGLFMAKNKILHLVPQGGMLEILARFAQLENSVFKK